MSDKVMDGEREYLRVAEVARAFHVSPKTVARWADEGRIPFVLTLGGHRRFPRKEIQALLPKLHGEEDGRAAASS
jgi:excisionase family DNA binding protein